MKRIIGLTGMSGSGKSTVAAVMKELGALLIDCDAISRDALDDRLVRRRLAVAFGADAILADGSVNRRLVAQRAFVNAVMTKRLNDATHPYILSELMKRIASIDDGQTAVIDAPLLFQCGLDEICTHTVMVTASTDTLIERICRRDGISRTEAAERLGAQNFKSEYTEKADFVIDNSVSVSAKTLKAEAVKIYNSIIKKTG